MLTWKIVKLNRGLILPMPVTIWMFTVYKDLISKSEEIGRMLNHMVDHPEKYVRQKEKITEH